MKRVYSKVISDQSLMASLVLPGIACYSHSSLTRRPVKGTASNIILWLLVLTDSSKDEAGEDVWLLVSGASLFFWLKYQWEMRE